MQVKRDNRTLHLSDIPGAEDISIAICYVGFSDIKKAAILDKIVLPAIEEALLRVDDPNKLQDTAADCIRHHEDDLVENLAAGYVTDQPTRAAIARWVREDQLGEERPNAALTEELQIRVDALLAEMEDQEMENPTEDAFRHMVRTVAGYA